MMGCLLQTRLLASWIEHLLHVLLRIFSGNLTAFSLPYLNKLFVAQIFYLIYNICERKLWKQAMRPVFITLHQKLEITCLRKRKLSETSPQLKLHASLRCENWLAISFLDNSFMTTFTNKLWHLTHAAVLLTSYPLPLNLIPSQICCRAGIPRSLHNLWRLIQVFNTSKKTTTTISELLLC